MELCPSLFCLFFCLLYFFLPPFDEWGCFSGCLMYSAGIQKLFCGIYSMFKCFFDEFSPSYSSAILAPLPFSAFSKTSINIWKFTVHILLKPGLKNLSITLLACEMSAIVR